MCDDKFVFLGFYELVSFIQILSWFFKRWDIVFDFCLNAVSLIYKSGNQDVGGVFYTGEIKKVVIIGFFRFRTFFRVKVYNFLIFVIAGERATAISSP
jgi:hypothetical protein